MANVTLQYLAIDLNAGFWDGCEAFPKYEYSFCKFDQNYELTMKFL